MMNFGGLMEDFGRTKAVLGCCLKNGRTNGEFGCLMAEQGKISAEQRKSLAELRKISDQEAEH